MPSYTLTAGAPSTIVPEPPLRDREWPWTTLDLRTDGNRRVLHGQAQHLTCQHAVVVLECRTARLDAKTRRLAGIVRGWRR